MRQVRCLGDAAAVASKRFSKRIPEECCDASCCCGALMMYVCFTRLLADGLADFRGGEDSGSDRDDGEDI